MLNTDENRSSQGLRLVRDDLDARISELESISKQREFTDAEIDEFLSLIKQHDARERQRKKQRARKLKPIMLFMERGYPEGSI